MAVPYNAFQMILKLNFHQKKNKPQTKQTQKIQHKLPI